MKNIIYKIILLVILGFPIVSAEQVVKIGLYYDEGILSLDKQPYVSTGHIIDSRGQYDYEIVSHKGELLHNGEFYINTYVTFDWYDKETGRLTGYGEDLKNLTYTLVVPYYPNAKSISISGADMESELDISLEELSACNENNICEENENQIQCPSDCKDTNKDGICRNIEDSICEEDPDCDTRDPDCIIEEKPSVEPESFSNKLEQLSQDKEIEEDTSFNWYLLLIILGVVLIIISLIVVIKKNH